MTASLAELPAAGVARITLSGGPGLRWLGRLLAASGTFDITDAHVVICARRAGQPVVTSDPDDLRRLDAALNLIVL